MAAPKVDPRVKAVLDRLSDLQARRANYDTQWRRIGELFAPSRGYTQTKQDGELRSRKVVDPIGILARKRFASFMYGYQMSPGQPWVEPYPLERDATAEEADWFEQVARRMHQYLTGPASPTAVNMAEAFDDMSGVGNTLIWRPKPPRGQLPKIRTMPLAECYVDEDAEGVTDTMYRQFTLQAQRAADRWQNNAELGEMASKAPRSEVTIVHAVEPRPGGKAGAIGSRKPWTSTMVLKDKAVVLEDDKGYDAFRFFFARFERASGQVYGTGPAWDAFPTVWSCNAILESVIRASEMRVDPPLFGDPNVFGGKLDRRPGAFNPVTGNALFARSVQDVIGQINIGGDVGIGVQLLQQLRGQVETMFYLDWLPIGDGPQKTATEILDRRDMRMRMLAPVAARQEQELLNPLVEDMFMALLDAGAFPPVPQTLAGELIGFRYRTPFSLVQQGQYVDAAARTFELTGRAMAMDPDAAQVLRSGEIIRKAASALGIGVRELVSREELQALREERAQREAAAQEAATAKDQASALQQGAQGLASLVGADQPAAA